MFKKLKSFFKKKPKSNSWRDLNKAEKDELIEKLLTRILDSEANIELLIQDIGDMPTYCDKCEGNKLQYCFKCNSTGVIKRSRLIGWPW